MEIVNPRDRDHRNIKTPLNRMVAEGDVLNAFRGRLLLELVHRLEKLPGPCVVANVFTDELLLCAGSRSVVRVAVDWQDYGPLLDGLPLAHYRIRVERPNVVLSEEKRTSDVEEASGFILQTLAGR